MAPVADHRGALARELADAARQVGHEEQADDDHRVEPDLEADRQDQRKDPQDRQGKDHALEVAAYGEDPHDTGDGAGGPQGVPGLACGQKPGQHKGHAPEQAGDDVQQAKALRTDAAFDRGSQHPQEHHVAPQVPPAGVQKHGREGADHHIPQVGIAGQEHQVVPDELRIAPGCGLVQVEDQDVQQDDAVGNPGDDLFLAVPLGVHDRDEGDVLLEQAVGADPFGGGLEADVEQEDEREHDEQQQKQAAQVGLDEDDQEDGQEGLGDKCLFLVALKVVLRGLHAAWPPVWL